MAGRGKGIVIDLIANTREFIAGTRKAEQSLDDFSDELTQVAKDGAKAGEKLEQSFKDVSRQVNRTGYETKIALGEVSDSARQNATETAASFDGSFESIVDGIQSTVAEALQGFGKIGVAAGLGAAGAIGLIVTGYQKLQEAQEKLNERANEYYTILQEAGGVIDANAQKELEQQAIAELGNGNYFVGRKKINEAIAEGVGTEAELLRLLTGQLIPADYARLDLAQKLLDQGDKLNKVIGGSDAVKARKDAISDAQTLLEFQQRGVPAVEAQAVYYEAIKNQLRDIQRLGLAAPGAVNAERAELSRVRP